MPAQWAMQLLARYSRQTVLGVPSAWSPAARWWWHGSRATAAMRCDSHQQGLATSNSALISISGSSSSSSSSSRSSRTSAAAASRPLGSQQPRRQQAPQIALRPQPGRRRSLATQVEPQTEASIYDHPDLYERAFSVRKIDAEVEFLRHVCAQHGVVPEPQATLELGCGPASHSLMMAQRGARAIALDCNQAMLAYADRRAQQQGGAGDRLLTCRADMQRFDLSDFEAAAIPAQVDLAFCLLGTLGHLLDNAAALNTFACVYRALRPGGLFVVELDHPEHLFSGCLMDAYGPEGRIDVWDVEQEQGQQPGGGESGTRVVVTWGSEEDTFDPISQVTMRRIVIKEVEGGSLGSGDGEPRRRAGCDDSGDEGAEDAEEDDDIDSGTVIRRAEEVVAQRMWTFQELSLLAQVSGFEVVRGYGAMDADVELEGDDAFRMVLVFKRVGELELGPHRWLPPGKHVYTGPDS